MAKTKKADRKDAKRSGGGKKKSSDKRKKGGDKARRKDARAAKKKGGKGGGAKKRPKKPKMADLADRHILYQKSVQAPDVDAEFMAEYYENYTGEPLRRFREDFCGTAILSCEFIKLHPENQALGVDLDRPTLDWGREHNVAELTDDQQERLTLVEGDVLEPLRRRSQLTCALNFSYAVFHERATLEKYFAAAFRGLEPGGLFMVDMWGGSDTQIEDEEDRHIDNPDGDDDGIGDFTYIWDQAEFDPATYRGVNKIHFQFRDGSELRDAFVYQWRCWTMPEVREVMAAVGFEDIHFLWEGTDPKTGEGNDVYERAEHGEADPAWIAYVVGVRP